MVHCLFPDVGHKFGEQPQPPCLVYKYILHNIDLQYINNITNHETQSMNINY